MATIRDERAATTESAAPEPGLRWLLPVLGILAFLVVGGALSQSGGKLSTVQRNDSAAFLPKGTESTRVLASSPKYTGMESTAAILVYSTPQGFTDEDRREIITFLFAVTGERSGDLAGPPMGPVVADDGRAAEVIVPLVGSDPAQLRGMVDWLRLRAPENSRHEVHVGGPAAALVDLTEVFNKINGVLLLITGLAVLLILVVAYRGPILPFIVLGVAGMALGMANGTVYLLAKANLVTVSGDAQGILDVLVLGAATDYALLLISRYREELRRHEDRYDAMAIAWRAAVAPILASGGTVIVALLCLLASNLASTRGLGPVAAVGIASALLSMLALLPAVLVLFGRAAFWPFQPAFGSAPVERRGAWARLAQLVGRRARLVWVVTALALGVLAVGLVRLEAHGVPRTESFRAKVDSTDAQRVLNDHFPASAGTPAQIVARADRRDAVLLAISDVPGIAKATTFVDPLEQMDRSLNHQPPPGPKVVNGNVLINATLDVPPDSPKAADTIRALRAAVHAVPGANAEVGGYTATNLDAQDTARRDRYVVIPLVLAVILGILMLLLRAVVAPVLLIGTVILSYLATLGVSGVVFRDIIGFAGADSSLPLFAFVFLVALGVDYNIFLMTRVREEAAHGGHRAGTLAGLAVTGGVITSAGVVLAATFGALAVLPLVFLAELAFMVAFGVLLDALVVRSLLVPALTVDIGRRMWWPSSLKDGPQ
jgi:RND superfamily putative drug exporter